MGHLPLLIQTSLKPLANKDSKVEKITHRLPTAKHIQRKSHKYRFLCLANSSGISSTIKRNLYSTVYRTIICQRSDDLIAKQIKQCFPYHSMGLDFLNGFYGFWMLLVKISPFVWQTRLLSKPRNNNSIETISQVSVPFGNFFHLANRSSAAGCLQDDWAPSGCKDRSDHHHF